MSAWIFLGVAIVSEVVGTSFLKQSDGFSKPIPTVITLVAYGIAFYALANAVRDIELGTAYAIWAGVGTALIVLIGWAVFHQSLDWAAVVGVGLIVLGVVVINAFSAIEA